MGYPITPPRQWRQGSHCYYLVLNYVGLGPVVCGPPTRGCVHPRSHYPVGRLNTLHGSHTTDWSVRSMVMNTPSIICTLYHRIPYCTRNTTCTPCTRNTRTMIYAHTSDPTVSSTVPTMMSRTIHQCYLYYILLLVCTLHPPHHAHATG